MSLKPLIRKQKLRIDDHKRGAKEVKDWDSPDIDIHIDKSTNYKVEGKIQEVRIRVPINSERPIKVENKRKQTILIPRLLEKEIKNAFENRERRNAFISDLVEELKHFSSLLDDEDKAAQALSKLSRHFDLTWKAEVVTSYRNGKLEKYTRIYSDDSKEDYLLSIDNKSIRIESITNWSKHEIRLKTN